jgi:hypothetical protein
METAVKSHRPRVGLIVAAVLAVAFFALVGIAVAGSNNTACGSCHAMQPFASSLASSPHAGTSCYDCHLPSGKASFIAFKAREITQMYPASLVGGTVQRPGAGVSRAACLRCHAEIQAKTVTAKGLRIDHATCAADVACDTCHGGTSHGTVAGWRTGSSMEECVACHKKQQAPSACDTCHAGKRPRDRLRTGAWQVTHGENWKSTHGQGDVRYCATCHPSSDCVRCHNTPVPHPADFGATHGKESLKPGASCETCHKGKELCIGCHKIPMPHPAGFLKRHSTVAKGAADPICAKCHDAESCNGCHTKHVHPGFSGGKFPSKPPTVPGAKR